MLSSVFILNLAFSVLISISMRSIRLKANQVKESVSGKGAKICLML